MNIENRIKNRDKAPWLNEEWGVGAVQVRYSYDGHWYAKLKDFPAALFDSNGYVRFDTKSEYENASQLRIRKQISVPKRISSMPNYVKMVDTEPVSDLADAMPSLDVDIHKSTATEGKRRLVTHLQRERNQNIVNKKKKIATSSQCEICGFDFVEVYGRAAKDYCEVHHLIPLRDAEDEIQTKLEDRAILCANCHRVVHLKNPSHTLEQVRQMLAKQLSKKK